MVNSHNQILATGFNGVASGVRHCSDSPCKGASYPSGQGLEFCEAIHAEANALIQCREPQSIHTAYVTASPCIKCATMLLNTTCQNIVFIEEYPHSESETLWKEHRSDWVHFHIDLFQNMPDNYKRLRRGN